MVFGGKDRELNIPVNMIGVEKANAKLKGLETSGNKAAKTMSTAFRALGPLITATLGVAVIKVVSDLAKVGMEAQETKNLVSASFRDMTKDAQEWAKESAAGMVTNRLELQANAAQLFNIATQLGIVKDKAFEMATGYSELTADLASFNNMRPEEVHIRIRAAMTGEFESLKQLGIVINESVLKHEALKRSAEGATINLNDLAQKAELIYEVIQDKAGPAVGDLERTMDSAANQAKVLEARLSEVRDELGLRLVPLQVEWNERLLATATLLQGDFSAALKKGAEDLERYAGALFPVVAAYQSIRRDIEWIKGGVSTGFTGPGDPDLGAFSQFGVMGMQGTGPQVTGTMGPPSPGTYLTWQIDPVTGRAIMAPVGWADKKRKTGGGVGVKPTSVPAGMPPWLRGVVGQARTTPGGIGIGGFGTGLTVGPSIFDELAGLGGGGYTGGVPSITGDPFAAIIRSSMRTRRERRLGGKIDALDAAFTPGGGQGGLLGQPGLLAGAGAGIATGQYGAAAGSILGSKSMLGATSALGGVWGPVAGMLIGGIIGNLTKKRQLAAPVEPIPVKVMNWDGLTQLLNVTKGLLVGGAGRGIDRLNDLRSKQAQVAGG